MNSLFLTVFNMSWTAAVIIGIVLLLRLALRKAPRKYSYLLWVVVLFRLLCPLTFESVFSLPIFTNPADIPQGLLLDMDVPLASIPALANETIGDIANGGLGILSISMGQTDSGEIIVFQAVHGQVWPLLLGYVWVIGMAVMLIRGVVSYAKLRRRLIGAVRLRDNIWLSDTIETPFVTGLFRPRIYLPSTLSEQEQSYIVLHEQTHIRRGDHVIRLLAFIALCVHWFNPLVRLAFHASGRDMEMSCDERVLSSMGADIKADYSASLLQFTTGKHILAATPLAFGEGDTKRRVMNILHYKKPALWVTVCAAIGITIAIVFLAMNRAQTPPRGTLAQTTVYVMENATQRSFFERMAVITLHPDGTATLRQSPISSYRLPPSIYYTFTDDELRLFVRLSNPTDENFYGVKDEDVLAVFRVEPDGALAYESSTVSLFASGRYVKENAITLLRENHDVVTRHFPSYAFRRTADSIIVTYLSGESYTLVSHPALDTAFFLDVTGDGVPELVYYTKEDSGFRLYALEFTPEPIYGTDTEGNLLIQSTDYSSCKRHTLDKILEMTFAMSLEDGLLSDGTPHTLRVVNGALVLESVDSSVLQKQEAPTIPKPTSTPTPSTATAVEWDGTDLSLPEYPDVVFLWQGHDILAVTQGESRTVLSGLPIWNVYMSDLTGDGNLDFCAGVSFGSGIADERVLVYDYAHDALYDLSDRTVYDYTLSLENGQLLVTQRDYLDHDKIHAVGTLALENGKLFLAGYDDAPQKAQSSAAVVVMTDLTEEEAPRALRYAVTDVLMNDRDAGIRPSVYRTYAGTILATSETETQVTAYLMVLSLGFGYADGAFTELSGSHMPMALTFDKENDGYTLREYWLPRDGSYNIGDIKAKFPSTVQADALDTQKFIKQHAIACYAFAIENGKVDTDAHIAALLESIADTSQNDYTENTLQYRELVYYGRYTLEYCFSQFIQGGQTDAHGKIMARACTDIMDALGMPHVKGDYATGQSWYDAQ